MVPFMYIVYEMMVGLKAATDAEKDPEIRGAIRNAQLWTVVSWCTYPVVYILPMLGVAAPGPSAVVGIQVGYCIADIISKCGVGLFIYVITNKKSKALNAGAEGYAPLN